MTMVGTSPAPEGTTQGTVLSESSQGFRNRDGLLRPASVTVAA
jgi:molecular chaperone GrpE (heat shock protein)